MSTSLIELHNRIITDEGETIAKPSLCLERILTGSDFKTDRCTKNKETELYNRRVPTNPMEIWEDDGQIKGPSEGTFEWTYPKSYKNVDVLEKALSNLSKKGLMTEEYIERIEQEYEEIEKRNMIPFLQCLLYITDQYRKNNVVWGVGRGSSCASLMLYALKINRIDPIKFGIPMEEFFK